MKPKAIRSILALALLVGLVLAVAPVALAANTWTVDAALADDSGCVASTFQCKTIGAAVAAAAAGDTINVLAGTYVLSAAVDVNKAGLTLDGAGAGATIVQVSGTGPRFIISAPGVTLQDFEIVKTDKTGEQNIIQLVDGNNVTIKNNTIHGQFVIGDGEVSRALIFNAGAFSGVNIEGNTIYALRQPAYISGTHTGTIQNNYVYGTKGWVLEGGNLTFTGNTWGTGANVNVYDIAILSNMSGTCPACYPDIVAMSNANNGAVIEDQRVAPPVLSVVYVDAATAYLTDLGGRYHPYSTIAPAVTRAVAGGTINVAAGTYDEDLNLTKSLSLLGAGAGSTSIRGPIGGAGTTVQVAASNVTIAGFTITRLGNNPTDWNGALNTAGIAVQGAYTGMLVHDNTLTGNRTAIDINNSSGHTIRNNVITDNRTGLVLRNQTDNLTVVENAITNNWTVGFVFLDASSGSNSPVQTALNCTFSNNNISGNWYGQIVDRQTGGSLPLPGANLKNFSGDWLGTTAPVVSTADSTEPGYSAQIPVAYGGTAVPPGGQPDILGPASANIDFTPYLNSGTDTNVETTLGRGTNGFQGDFSNLWVTAAGAQTGATGRVQEGINSVSGSTVNVAAGLYVGDVNIPASVTLKGAQYGVAVSGRTAASPSESTLQGLVTVDAGSVVVDGFTLTNPGQTYAFYVKNHTPSHSVIAFTHNIVDTVGAVGLGSNVHAVLLNQGPDSVTIAHNRFNNIKAGAKSVSAVGVLDSASTDPSNGLVIEDNTFSDIASATKGAYGVILNNGAGGSCVPNIPGGGVPGAQIKDNTFSGLSGGWTHAIGLEGPTPGAVVSGNDFSGLTATSADNLAIHFEKNPVGNTVTIYHNTFNGSAFYGVGINPVDLPSGCNGYNYAVNADNNYWGDVSGPGPVGLGSGAKVGTGIDFQPWCNADFSNCTYTTGAIAMLTSGTPAEVGDIVTMDSQVTGDNVYAMQLRVSYDATALQFQAPPASSYNNVAAASWYWDNVPDNFVAVTGGRRLSGTMTPTYHSVPAMLTGQSVATWKFKCLKAGTWALTYDQTPLFGTYLSTKDSENIPAVLTGATVECLATTASVDGWIKLQGRQPTNPVPAAWQGTVVTLTCVDTAGIGCNGFGPYTMTTDASGHYEHLKTAIPGSGVVLGTYSATAARRAYLGAAKTANVVVVSGSNTINTLATAPRLLGGDVVPGAPGSGITMADLSAIGGAFGTSVTPADTGNDVNGDGAVNIFDLVLAGGNLDQPFPQPW